MVSSLDRRFSSARLRQLASFGGAAVAGAEALCRPCDLAGAPGERLAQFAGDTSDLEVPSILAGALLDRVSLSHELVGERGAVERAELPRGAKERPRSDRHDPVVLTDSAGDHDVAVQLRVRRLGARDAAGGGVSVLGRDHILGVLFHNLPAVTPPHNGYPLAQVEDRLLDRPAVGLLDLPTLPRIAERPHRRDGLRCAERHIDPATPTAAGALRSQPSAGTRVATLHQRDEVRAIDRPVRLNPQSLQGLFVGEPAAGSLGHLPVRGQVVVPALRRHRLALQVARVAATPGRTYARRSHHISDDPQHPEAATELRSARTPAAPPCMLSVWALVLCAGRASRER